MRDCKLTRGCGYIYPYDSIPIPCVDDSGKASIEGPASQFRLQLEHGTELAVRIGNGCPDVGGRSVGERLLEVADANLGGYGDAPEEYQYEECFLHRLFIHHP